MGLETDDVFSQGLKLPECLKILFNCLENLETKMQNIKEISLAAKDWQIKGTQQLNDKNKAINFTNKKFENFEKALKKKDEETKLLEKENNCLNKRLGEMDAAVDRQEQYSRRNCLLVHRIEEGTVEDTDEKIINALQHSIQTSSLNLSTIKSNTFYNFYHYSITELSSSIKHIHIISNCTTI